MSYFDWKEYEVVPVAPYKILHKCGGCGCKMSYQTTGNFRVNANGNCIDVWMIYQCERCKHTYNLPIYERVNPKTLAKEEYRKFLENDAALIIQYGTSMQLMRQNKVEVEWTQTEYEIIGSEKAGPQEPNSMVIHNPYGIRLRTDKVLAEILHVSRKKVLDRMNERTLIVSGKSIGSNTEVIYKEQEQMEKVS